MRSNRTRIGLQVAGTVALVVGVTVGTFVATHAATQASSVAADTADTTGPPDLSAAALSTASAMKWDISIATPLARMSTQAIAERATAMKAATESINMLQGHSVRGASLADVTVHNWGKPVDPSVEDPTEDQLVLKVKNQKLWVVQVADVDVPSFGPVGYKGPLTGRSDMLVLVEPDTYKTITIESLNADAPESTVP
jgi:hypothetical protein